MQLLKLQHAKRSNIKMKSIKVQKSVTCFLLLTEALKKHVCSLKQIAFLMYQPLLRRCAQIREAHLTALLEPRARCRRLLGQVLATLAAAMTMTKKHDDDHGGGDGGCYESGDFDPYCETFCLTIRLLCRLGHFLRNPL